MYSFRCGASIDLVQVFFCTLVRPLIGTCLTCRILIIFNIIIIIIITSLLFKSLSQFQFWPQYDFFLAIWIVHQFSLCWTVQKYSTINSTVLRLFIVIKSLLYKVQAFVGESFYKARDDSLKYILDRTKFMQFLFYLMPI